MFPQSICVSTDHLDSEMGTDIYFYCREEDQRCKYFMATQGTGIGHILYLLYMSVIVRESLAKVTLAVVSNEDNGRQTLKKGLSPGEVRFK